MRAFKWNFIAAAALFGCAIGNIDRTCLCGYLQLLQVAQKRRIRLFAFSINGNETKNENKHRLQNVNSRIRLKFRIGKNRKRNLELR